MLQSLHDAETLHPNYYTGNRRFSKKSADHFRRLVNLLILIGLVEGCDFETGTDAPRTGWSGLYVRLINDGKARLAYELTNY